MSKTFSNNLIISADDFGINATTNQNIIELIDNHRLDRVAVMIDGVFSLEEIAILKNSGIKLDLHLETPFLTNQTNHQLSSGVIGRLFRFAKLYFSGELRKERISAIWEAQCQKFFTVFNQSPDGLNSHEHLHYFPSYFKVVIDLGNKYHCHHLRFGKSGITWALSPVRQILWLLNKINARKFRHSNLHSSDWVTSFDWIDDISQINNYLLLGTVELIFHPERMEEKKALLRK